MAQISKEEFLAMQASREAAQKTNQNQNRPRVGFFGLRDDGDEAIVRFNYNDVDDFYKDLYTVHPVTIDGKFRKVNCINDIKNGVHTCPLCEAGVQLQNKFYIQLIEYTRDEQGNIVPQARVWERPTSYMQLLGNLVAEYGPLKDSVFKIKRVGERGNMQTTYNIMFCNPSIYNDQLYTKDFSVFEGYTPLGSAIIDRDANGLRELAGDLGLDIPNSAVGTPDYTSAPTAPPVQSQFITPQFNSAPQTPGAIRKPQY